MVRAEQLPICSHSLSEYICEVLEFTATATYKVNVINISRVGDESATDGDCERAPNLSSQGKG